MQRLSNFVRGSAPKCSLCGCCRSCTTCSTKSGSRTNKKNRARAKDSTCASTSSIVSSLLARDPVRARTDHTSMLRTRGLRRKPLVFLKDLVRPEFPRSTPCSSFRSLATLLVFVVLVPPSNQQARQQPTEAKINDDLRKKKNVPGVTSSRVGSLRKASPTPLHDTISVTAATPGALASPRLQQKIKGAKHK